MIMKHPLISLAALVLTLLPARAEEMLTPEEFAEFALGWTLYFERDGEPWGAEEFRGDGSVRWQFQSGDCTEGIWRPYQGAICFTYEDAHEILCWQMSRSETDDRLIAKLVGQGEGDVLELEIVRKDKRPLICSPEGTDT